MNLNFFLRGLVIGFSIAAPVGPIGILCIRRTIAQGRISGLLSGLGAATADAIYGCIAGFGLTLISSILLNQAVWFRFVGGVFLCYLGIKTFMKKSAEEDIESKTMNLISAYVSTFFLTLTNPITILSFTAIFAGLGIANTQGDYIVAGVLVLGIFLGSAFWWVLLTTGVSLFQTQFNRNQFRWLNRVSGLILLIFGIIALNLKS